MPEEKKARRLMAERAREEPRKSQLPILTANDRPRIRPVKEKRKDRNRQLEIEDTPSEAAPPQVQLVPFKIQLEMYLIANIRYQNN